MQEKTTEEYLAVLKTLLDTVQAVVLQIAEEAGIKSDEERRALDAGMKLAPQSQIRGVNGHSVPLHTGSGEPDWKTLREIFLKAPEPSREEKEAAMKLLNSIHYILRRAFAKTAKKLPHAPGGHPFALQDPKQRLAVCKRIEALRIKDHLDTAEAINKVALDLNKTQHAVSRKTLRRYYDKYVQEQTRHKRARKSIKNRKVRSDT